MEILNEIAGAPITELTGWLFVAAIFLILGACLVGAGGETGSGGAALTGVLFLVIFTIFIFSDIPFTKPTGKFEPNRIEVRITDPNYIVDATKYKLVKTEGKILTFEVIENAK